MIFRRTATGRLAARRRFVPRCCRLPPTYRYAAASFIACIVYVAHLFVNQAFLPVQTTDAVRPIAGQHPTTVNDDAVVDTSLTSTTFNHAFDWAVSHDTGCDVMITDRSYDADNMVCHHHCRRIIT